MPVHQPVTAFAILEIDYQTAVLDHVGQQAPFRFERQGRLPGFGQVFLHRYIMGGVACQILYRRDHNQLGVQAAVFLAIDEFAAPHLAPRDRAP